MEENAPPTRERHETARSKQLLKIGQPLAVPQHRAAFPAHLWSPSTAKVADLHTIAVSCLATADAGTKSLGL